MLSKRFEFVDNGKVIASIASDCIENAMQSIIEDHEYNDEQIKTLKRSDVRCYVYNASVNKTNEHIQGFCIARPNDDSIEFWSFKGGFDQDYLKCMVYGNTEHAWMVIDNLKVKHPGPFVVMPIDGRAMPMIMIDSFIRNCNVV